MTWCLCRSAMDSVGILFWMETSDGPALWCRRGAKRPLRRLLLLQAHASHRNERWYQGTESTRGVWWLRVGFRADAVMHAKGKLFPLIRSKDGIAVIIWEDRQT